MPAKDRRHHTDRRFVVGGEALRRAAGANPNTRCSKCGGTLAEGIAQWGPRAGAWDAGHVNDSQVGGPLTPQHAHCNRSDGARLGNQRRATGFDWP